METKNTFGEKSTLGKTLLLHVEAGSEDLQKVLTESGQDGM